MSNLTCPECSNTCESCGRQQKNRDLVNAIESIAHGDYSSPGGLEALAMSLSGEAPYDSANSVTSGLRAIAAAIDNLAEAVRES